MRACLAGMFGSAVPAIVAMLTLSLYGAAKVKHQLWGRALFFSCHFYNSQLLCSA
jgi:hypothetical protein